MVVGSSLGEPKSPPGDTSVLAWFWVPEEEPPGGTSLAARRCMAKYPVLGFWMKGLAVLVESPGDASRLGSIL